MSLATLKKKTKAIFNNPHIGDKYGKYKKMSAVRMNSYNNQNGNINAGFSLNGTHRSQGYVGQTMLSRHFPQTPMRGNVARGHGGCCGQYPTNNGHIIQSGVDYLNNPNVVKKSVQSTQGYLHNSYKWIWRPQPFTCVKPDDTNNINDQASYINHLTKKTMLCTDLSNNLIQQKPCINTYMNNSATLLNSIVYTKRQTTNITKPPLINKTKNAHYQAGLSAGEHIYSLSNSCQINDVFTVANNKQNMAFGCSNPR
jgi:hypothetical protein